METVTSEQAIAQLHSADVIQKLADAQEATEKARAAQMKAAVAEGTAEIMVTLTKLIVGQTKLAAGQANTNEHLVRLNGSVAEHEKKLNTVLLWKAEVRGFTGAVSTGWTSVLALLGGVAGSAILLFFKK